jgi:hypothetical protein
MTGFRRAAMALTAAAIGSAASATAAAQVVGELDRNGLREADNIGFSFFLGLGGETARYREKSSLLPVESKATATSPLIVSGALYAINRDLLFSLSNTGTFAPRGTTETWTATSTQFNGQALVDRVVQRNGFSLAQNTTQLLGYWRLGSDWFAVAGPSLHTQTFKRYSFTQGVDQAVDLPTDRTIEESTSEILANIGIALESGRVRGEASHYGLRAMLGLPVWARTDNTEWPDVHFKSTSGVDLALEARYSRALFEDIHAGLWGQWMTSVRRSTTAGPLELPRSRLSTLSYGLELLWKL